MKTRNLSPEETYVLRNKVLWPHKKSLAECVMDIDDLETTFHVGVEKEGEIVAIGTFIKQNNPNFDTENQYRLRAMATAPEVRGQGAGRMLINDALEQLKTKNISLLWCDARLVAVAFYKKMGFKIKGKQYEIPIIGPHYLMYKEL